jgi:hypothetical protein
MLASAVLCAAHARLAARGEWVLNEKRLAARAGLDDAGAGRPGDDLPAAVARVAEAIEIEPLRPR